MHARLQAPVPPICGHWPPTQWEQLAADDLATTATIMRPFCPRSLCRSSGRATQTQLSLAAAPSCPTISARLRHSRPLATVRSQGGEEQGGLRGTERAWLAGSSQRHTSWREPEAGL